jgi:hypothetical protein
VIGCVAKMTTTTREHSKALMKTAVGSISADKLQQVLTKPGQSNSSTVPSTGQLEMLWRFAF